ncbi:MAG: iron-containing redox enzyme family protein [Synechococcales cyanobacterium C42_A2020_086]|nr:iron-containing redox enzyme family protein [Synechococcales cyanobacterium C42_A2020_086]
MTMALRPEQQLQDRLEHVVSASQPIDYGEAEQQFIHLLTLENLDQHIATEPSSVSAFEVALSAALTTAYLSDELTPLLEVTEGSEVSEERQAAHRFLQRILYRINRLNFFWYSDLQQYQNERAFYVQWVRERIEQAWQPWELAQLAAEVDLATLQQLSLEQVKQGLIERCERDLNPPLTDYKQYVRETMTLAGYRQLIALVSLDGLVESSRLCHILGGASNEVQATLIRVLLEEYGNGRLSRKHSTFFAHMMQELGLNAEPETYFDLVPWEGLASINHNFLLTERKRHFLRYNGGFTYFEIVGPSIYRDYMRAAQRLGLSDTAMGYWELHIREDERHGQWMLHNVALALADYYPQDAWELLWGYDQERWMGERAGKAAMQAILRADATQPELPTSI